MFTCDNDAESLRKQKRVNTISVISMGVRWVVVGSISRWSSFPVFEFVSFVVAPPRRRLSTQRQMQALSSGENWIVSLIVPFKI